MSHVAKGNSATLALPLSLVRSRSLKETARGSNPILHRYGYEERYAFNSEDGGEWPSSRSSHFRGRDITKPDLLSGS